MRRLTLSIFCFLLLTAWAAASEPPLPRAGLFKPTFLRLNGSWSAGTAFVVKDPNGPDLLLVTPDHLFGPDGGVEQQMTPDEIAQQVVAAVGVSMQDKKTLVTTGNSLEVADAHPLGKEGTDKDLVVFPVSANLAVDGFEFAAAAPARGATIWMYARARGETKPKLFSAVVLRSSDTQLVYRFEGDPFNPAGTSGAPLLDADGKVVGMNVGGGKTGSVQVGSANPTTAIRAELAKIAKQ
jgi:hypothetical protein